MGWRTAYFIYTVPCLILAGLLLFSRPDTTPQVKVATASKGKVSIRPFVLSLALVTGAQLMNGFIYRGVVTFLPTYFGERIHLNLLNMDSTLLAGSFTTIALLFGVIGQFFSGYLCEKMRREILAVIVPLATIPLLLIIGNSTELLLIITASIFAFFHFMGQPVYNNLIADYSPADWRGTMYGIYYFCTFGIGSFSASISGYIADKFGIDQVFLVSAGFGLISLAAASVILIRALRASKRRQINTEIS
jgi:predicted MFS family arabinose efflux permease